MRWLNDNAGAVQALSTVLLVLVTIYYAVSTRRLAKDGQLSRLAAFEPVLVPVSLTCRAVTINQGARVVEFSLRLANSGQGTAYSVRPVLRLKSGEQEAMPPKRPGPIMSLGHNAVHEEDKRPMSPAEDAIPGSSYQDFTFRISYGSDILVDGNLDLSALKREEKTMGTKAQYRTTFGREPTLTAEFVWSGDALVLGGTPRTTGAVLS